MASIETSLWQRWITPNREWNGPKAMVPVGTCYRILELFSWLDLGLGMFGVYMGYRMAPELLNANPVFLLVLVLQLPLLGSVIFRGWPFMVRYAAMAVQLFGTTVGTAAIVGITPNWAFQVIILLGTTSLFFGTRAGLLAVLVVIVAQILVAWGWVTGHLPAYLSGAAAVRPYLDFTTARVWIRVTLVMAGFQVGLVILMRYVLRDMNNALKESTRSLQSLAVEQEHRARAEEARQLAENSAREAQKFDALGRLAGGVAHDINNSLCVVKCWNSVLSAESADPLVKEAMAEIAVATESAHQLTQHLLAFSRNDPAKAETVDLADVVKREARTLERLLPKAITVTTEAAGPAYVRLGRGPLQEAILNLAINARDAMPSGGRLILRVRRETAEFREARHAAAARILLEVEDSGTGMDETVKARIFEPFFTTKEAGHGTGLGLPMVYGLVTGAGGIIRVRTAPGQGTCFTILLPEAEAPLPAPAAKSPAVTTGERRQVLVADDNQEIRTLLKRILERDGFGVVLAENGNVAAAAIAAHGGIGLLIADGVMPGKPTSEIIRLAEARNPHCRVIVSSGHKQNELLRLGIETGKYILLPKPFELSQVRAAVSAALGQPVG